MTCGDSLFFLCSVSHSFAAGTCWAKRTQSGKCKHPMERNVSKEKCCGGGDDVGFTEKEMSEFEYFFATALGDGTTCGSCIGRCILCFCTFYLRYEILAPFHSTICSINLFGHWLCPRSTHILILHIFVSISILFFSLLCYLPLSEPYRFV